jgi:hypothetical protein
MRRRILDSLVSGGVAYLVLFLVVHTVLALTSADPSLLDVLELALIGVPYSVLVVRRRLSPGLTIILAACLIAVAGTGIYSLPTDGRIPGYDAWFLGAITFVLLGFTLTGRYLAAWLILLCVAGIAVGWSMSTGQGPWPGVQLVDRHFATLLVGTLFSVSYRRSNASFAAFKAAERRDRSAERAAEARAGARRSAAESVLEQAGPMLRAIAEGHRLNAADRQELLVLEGTLRDQIRAPDLITPRLRDAIAAARRRGVNVLLLDETGGVAAAPARAAASAWLAEQVRRAEGDRFVGRVRAEGDGALKVTGVAGDASNAVSIPVAQHAEPAPAF